jgi:hypothetical protein
MGLMLAIDFDGVIHDKAHPLPGMRMGAPLPETAETMERLYNGGAQLIIFTVMATSPAGHKAVADWLDYYHIRYHVITAIKPNADYFIDDKAIRHTDWASTLASLGLV